MKLSLPQLRKKIDEVDSKLIRLLNERTKLVLQIGKWKHNANAEIYAPARENAVLKRIVDQSKGPLKPESLRAIYREIMSSALVLEKPLIIAYLGPEATHSHMAACKRFGSSLQYQPKPSISDVFSAVAKGQADYGVVPIENSTEGAVTHTYDMLVESELKICAQIVHVIQHNLMASCPRQAITKLYSNPQVFAQSRRWLEANMPYAELIEVSSTTRAAELCKGKKDSGALASTLAAKLYQLKIYDSNIQDSSENATRFFVMGRKSPPHTGDDKTSIMFSTQDKVGALHDSIAAFKRHRISMTKIESRPSKKKAWEYYFFADFHGHTDDVRVKKALAELARHTMFVKILGSYPNTNN